MTDYILWKALNPGRNIGLQPSPRKFFGRKQRQLRELAFQLPISAHFFWVLDPQDLPDSSIKSK
jgi:hypothetical protein